MSALSPVRPAISVIIPSYKPAEYLRECIASLDAQTLGRDEFEVILILNGCGEPWQSEVPNLLKEFPGLQAIFIHTMTPGVSNARNIGLEKARGRYIAFIDDDDYVSPDYLKEFIRSAREEGDDPATMILSDSRAFLDGKEGWLSRFPQQVAYAAAAPSRDQRLTSVRTILNGPCLKLIPKEMIGDTRFDTSLRNGEDALFIYTLSCRIRRLAYAAPTAIYYRRYREGSAVTSRKPLSYRLSNALRLSAKFGAVWLRHPLSYDLPFTISRLLAPLKTIF